MADEDRDSNAEEEENEVGPDSRFVRAKDETTYKKVLANRMKVVVVAFLVPGYAHCETVLQKLKEYSEDATAENTVILVADPNALPRVAKRNGLVAVPSFFFCWRKKPIYSFSGTNQEKLHYYFTRCLELRADYAANTTLWGRHFNPQQRLLPGHRVRLARLQPELHNAFVGVGWDSVEKALDDKVEVDLVIAPLGADRLVPSADDLVSTRTPKHRSGSIVHHAGTMRGDGSGDDVTAELALLQIPQGVVELQFFLVVTSAGHTVSQVKEPYIRLYDKDRTGEKEEGGVDEVPPLLAFDADEDCFGCAENPAAPPADAVSILLLGRLHRQPESQWEFEASGEPRRGTYAELCRALTGG